MNTIEQNEILGNTHALKTIEKQLVNEFIMAEKQKCPRRKKNPCYLAVYKNTTILIFTSQPIILLLFVFILNHI